MKDPVFVFESDTQKDSFVVMTEIEVADESVMAAIHFNRDKKGNVVASDLASVYSKPDSVYGKFIENRKTLYWNKEKANRWMSQSHPVQFRQLWLQRIRSSPNIISNYDISQDGNVRFSRGENAAGISKQRAFAVIDAILPRMTRRPVVRVMTKEEFARETGKTITNQEGAIQGNTVYLFHENLPTEADAARVLIHEIVGHYGVQGAFGDRFNETLDLVANLYRNLKSGRDIAARYSNQAAKPGGHRIVAEEIIAHLADGRIRNPGAWRRVVAGFKQMLRKAGIKVQLRETDIQAILSKDMRKIVSLGAEYVEGRTTETQGTQRGDDVRWSRTDIKPDEETLNIRVATEWLKIARDPDTQVMTDIPTTMKSMREIFARLVSPEALKGIQIHENRQGGGHPEFIFTDPQGKRMFFYANHSKPYVDSTESPQFATAMYQAIYAYAHNNGLVVHGDPAGLSEIAQLRRTSQMLNSAIRFNTTRHMMPRFNQWLRGWNPENTPKATLNNIGIMARREAEIVFNRLPELEERFMFDPETGGFYDTINGGKYRIPDNPQGRNQYLMEGIAGLDPEFATGSGPRTLARALVTVSLEAKSIGGGTQHAPPTPREALKNIRYSKPDESPKKIKSKADERKAIAALREETKRRKAESQPQEVGVIREEAPNDYSALSNADLVGEYQNAQRDREEQVMIRRDFERIFSEDSEAKYAALGSKKTAAAAVSNHFKALVKNTKLLAVWRGRTKAEIQKIDARMRLMESELEKRGVKINRETVIEDGSLEKEFADPYEDDLTDISYKPKTKPISQAEINRLIYGDPNKSYVRVQIAVNGPQSAYQVLTQQVADLDQEATLLNAEVRSIQQRKAKAEKKTIRLDQQGIPENSGIDEWSALMEEYSVKTWRLEKIAEKKAEILKELAELAPTIEKAVPVEIPEEITPELQDKIKKIETATIGTGRMAQFREKVLGGIVDFFKGFTSAIPEATSFSGFFTNRRLYNDTAKARARLFEGLSQIKNAAEYARHTAVAAVTDVTKPLENLPPGQKEAAYELFRQGIYWRDLFWRSHMQIEGYNEDGTPRNVTLPENLTQGEVLARLKQIQAALETSPHKEAIENAWRNHYDLVRNMGAALADRGYHIPDALKNPLYFPHKVIENWTGDLQGVKISTESDFRGYLLDPYGTTKTHESDYFKAMYTHVAEVFAHNLREDVIQKYWKPFDQSETIAKAYSEYRKGLQASRSRDIPQTFMQFVEDRFPGYVRYKVDKGMRLQTGFGIDRAVIEARIEEALDPIKWREQLNEKGIAITTEDVQKMLVAAEKETWLVPQEIADALRGMERRAKDPNGRAAAIYRSATITPWKRFILNFPTKMFRYQFNNLVTDLEKVWTADPGMVRQMATANKQIKQWLKTGQFVSDEQREAFKRGVLTTVTASEVQAVFQDPRMKQWDDAGFWTRAWRNPGNILTMSQRFSRYREGVFRYAKYLADLDRLNQGVSPVYAGSRWAEVEGLSDKYDKAAKIARETFVDYAMISPNGEWLRKNLIPFYSWTEGNLRYHINLFNNFYDLWGDPKAKAMMRRYAATVPATVAAKTINSLLMPNGPAGFALRLAAVVAIIHAWNNRDEEAQELEKQLSEEDRRRLHITLGKDADGNIMVIYTPTAFSDVLKFVGGFKAAEMFSEMTSGRITFRQAAVEWSQEVVANQINSISPFIIAPIEYMTERKFFPDVFSPRPIDKHDLYWHIASKFIGPEADLIRSVVDKEYYSPKEFSHWAQQVILQIRRRNPEQWASIQLAGQQKIFMADKDDLKDRQKMLIQSFSSAMGAGDFEASMNIYNMLIDEGYTSEQIAGRLRLLDPIARVPKKYREEYIAWLSPQYRDMIDLAYNKAAEVDHDSIKELFPSKKDELSSAEREQWKREGMEKIERMLANKKNIEAIRERGQMMKRNALEK
ncbi:hypothetical protein QQ054_31765 [Oscillatoria amoena NRMC-F 0135]|nr:hypothetical protein [Oscillatoria amoena NRMC-F 0135]MDL5055597.1 hypothetical protein [Oscillatoria laete-virens NRMC-F 0139]